MSPRVCMVTGFRPTTGGGGTEKHVAELSRGLAERGFDVSVICEDRTHLPDPDGDVGIRVIGIDSEHINAQDWVPRYLEKSRLFARSLDPSEYDIVHCHSHWGYHTALKLAKLDSRPTLVSTFHLTPLGSLERFRQVGWDEPEGAPIDRAVGVMEETAAHLSDRCIAVSRGVGREVSELYGVPAWRVTPVHNWYNPSVFYPVGRDPARAQLGLALDSSWLLYVGHFGLERGKLLAAAMRRLPEHVRLIVIHPEPEEAIRREFGDRVHFAGYVAPPDMPVYYSAADLQCFPAVYGAFGLVIVEGMACGCPAIAFDYPAMNEIISSESGYLVPEATAEAYAAGIEGALLDAHAKRGAAISRARDFTMDPQIDRVAEVYRQVLGTSRTQESRQTAGPSENEDRDVAPAKANEEPERAIGSTRRG